MCDYCGCRSLPVIDGLGDDHEALLAHCGAVRRAVAAGDDVAARAALAELIDRLRLHTAIEEATVFRALVAAGEFADTVDELDDDHRRARAAIDELVSLPAAVWPSAALALVDDLRHHIAREEYDLFPAVGVALSAAQLDQIEATERSMRIDGHDHGRLPLRGGRREAATD